jgi:hypothetical protein
MVNAVHVGISYSKAVSAKKDILNCEKEFLEIIRHIKIYDSLKKREISLKNKVKKEISNLRLMIVKIQEDLPKTEETRRFDKNKKEEIFIKPLKEKRKIIPAADKEDRLEAELREIQEKLDRLNSL